MDVFKGKNKRYHKQLTKLGRIKVLLSRPSTTMFVVSFPNFKSCTPSCNPSGGCVMPRGEVRVRAQASHGNFTVVSHLKWNLACLAPKYSLCVSLMVLGF